MEKKGSEQDHIMGRQPGDSEKLFPRFTHAAAASTSQVTLNGRPLKIWTFSQLETLSGAVLKQRAMAIRDAVEGQIECPTIPSGQPQDLVRWILHMQSLITGEDQSEGRTGGYGTGHFIPKSFAQDTRERPIIGRGDGETRQDIPFGPRSANPNELPAARDNFYDLKYQQNDFKEAPNLGIQSMRPGGEGKRHIQDQNNMISFGVSEADPRGIQTLKTQGEGRRSIGVHDNVMNQKKELQATDGKGAIPEPGWASEMAQRNSSTTPVKHVSESFMVAPGVADPDNESPIGGSRRRHADPGDKMASPGIAAPDGEGALMGRRKLDCFKGSCSNNHKDRNEMCNASWKKDPSRLRGTSMII